MRDKFSKFSVYLLPGVRPCADANHGPPQ